MSSGCVFENTNHQEDILGTDLSGSLSSVPPVDCWWCVDAEGYFDTSALAGLKDDGEEVDDPFKTRWWADINAETGLGVFGFTRIQPDGKDCALHYLVENAVMEHRCGACSFAWAMTLGKPSVDLDKGGCSDAATLEGHTILYGHGSKVASDSVSDVLWVDDADGTGWEEVGVSQLDAGNRWTFSRNVEAE